MKKSFISMLVFACLFTATSLAQGTRPRAVASPAQLQERAHYIPPILANPAPTSAKAVPLPQPRPQTVAAQKVTNISPVQIGTASNVFTIMRPEQNQVSAIDSLDLVAFIHRNDISIYGGSSGHLRYDVSLNGGASFITDQGPINPLLSRLARYPNMTSMNFAGNNPLSAKFVFGAPTLTPSASGWNGVVVGLTEIVTSGTPPVGTEHYITQNLSTHLPGGLCQSAPGRYWMVSFNGDGTFPVDRIFIYNGVWNQSLQDVDWQVSDSIMPNNFLGVNGDAALVGPNIAFAPDGETGWIAWLGDIVGGRDSSLQPIFCKTTDCGATWSAPIEVDLNSAPWVADSLQTLWVDSLGNPASNGRATAGFDFDLTVDGNGNPHLAVVIGTGIDYSMSSGLAKFLGEISSNSGGATWDISYISPVLTFRSPDFGSSTTVNMDNFVQVSRDEGGCNIFYSWADSDTSLSTGNGNGIGFGESTNSAPNLRISALNVATGQRMYPKLVTDLDLIWDSQVLFPTMAPVVLSDANGWQLPIVCAVMTANDPVNPATFWYLGNDAVIPNNGWCTPSAMNLSWDYWANNQFVSPCTGTAVATCNGGVNGPCAIVAVAPKGQLSSVTLGDVYPNPAHGTAQVSCELAAATDVQLTLRNALGQTVAILAQGEVAAGTHTFAIPTAQLAEGMYMLHLRTPEGSLSRRLVVAR